MEKEEKERVKLRFAAALSKALAGHPKVNSLRQLALEIDKMDVTELQKIGRAKREASLSKMIDISQGLGIPFATLAGYYDEITKEDIQGFCSKLEKRKKKGHKKKGASSSPTRKKPGKPKK